ncbi:MAG: hypothetical protein ACC662_08775, partial [Planctomycetota bacterium]
FPAPQGESAPPAFPPPQGTAPPQAPAPGPAASRPPTFAEVKALLARVGERATVAYAVAIWVLPHQAFLDYRFPVEEVPGATAALVVPGDAKASNLVRMLRDGKGIEARRPSGPPVVVDEPRWPKGGPYMPEADIAKIEAWIDAGCPEKASR